MFFKRTWIVEPASMGSEDPDRIKYRIPVASGTVLSNPSSVFTVLLLWKTETWRMDTTDKL